MYLWYFANHQPRRQNGGNTIKGDEGTSSIERGKKQAEATTGSQKSRRRTTTTAMTTNIAIPTKNGDQK